MVLEKNEVLTIFDGCVFESIVEKVIIGEIDEDGKLPLPPPTHVEDCVLIEKK